MPARARRLRLPPRLDDPQADLAQLLVAMDPDELAIFAASLEPDDLAVLESVLGEQLGTGWRRSPAAMAEHLVGAPLFNRWRYVDLLSDRLVAAVDGDSPRQVWNIPSQMGKTTVLCTYGVPWILQRDPSLRIMYVTHDANKAVEEGGKARDLIEEHAAELGVELRPDRRARGMWRTRQGGGLYCVGIHGGIVGWPVDVMLLDDLLAGWQAAHSEAQRDTVWAIYRSQVRMRLQGSRCPIILAGTRWHEDDPTGKVTAAALLGGEPFEVTRLPAIAEAPTPEFPEPDPLGRDEGEVIEPERFPLEEVMARAVTLGPYLAAAMEQQRPSPEEGNDILRSWFDLVEPQDWPNVPDHAITSWDLKLKNKQAGDYVVGQTWWRVGGGYYLVDQLRGQWDHAQTADAIALLSIRHPEVATHVVENAGSADEVLPELRKARPGYEVTDEIAWTLGMTTLERAAVETLRRRGMSGLVPENVTDGAKPVRARAFIAPAGAAGDIHLPAEAGWVPAYLDEMAAFPNGKFDDQVDASSQALKRLAHGAATVSTGAGKSVTPAMAPTAGGARSASAGRPGSGASISSGAGRRASIGRGRRPR